MAQYEYQILANDLSRRLLVFDIYEKHVYLVGDYDQTRKTKRHKWATEQHWSFLEQRDNKIKEMRDVPAKAAMSAMEHYKSLIVYYHGNPYRKTDNG